MKQKAVKAPKAPKQNTAVYVTSLPLNATVDEIHEVFSRCGVIAEEIDSQKPRIKLYEDEAGNPKGDALVVYFRPESINLAIQMLDDSDFRYGEVGPYGKMRVSEADRTYKKQQDQPVENNGDGEGVEGEVKRKQAQSKDKKKIIKKTQKLNKYVRVARTPVSGQVGSDMQTASSTTGATTIRRRCLIRALASTRLSSSNICSRCRSSR